MFDSLSTSDLQTRLSAAYDKLDATLNGESYQIGTRSLKRPDLDQLMRYIERLERELDARNDGNIINVTFPSPGGTQPRLGIGPGSGGS